MGERKKLSLCRVFWTLAYSCWAIEPFMLFSRYRVSEPFMAPSYSVYWTSHSFLPLIGFRTLSWASARHNLTAAVIIISNCFVNENLGLIQLPSLRSHFPKKENILQSLGGAPRKPQNWGVYQESPRRFITYGHDTRLAGGFYPTPH